MMYVILVAGLLNFFLGVLTLRNSKRDRSLIAFAVFCIVTSIWVISNFLVYYYHNTVFVRLTYALGSVVSASLLAWSFFYNSKKKYFWIPLVIYLTGFMLSAVSLLSKGVIESVGAIGTSGYSAKEGRLFIVWGIYMLGTYIWSLYNISLLYRKSDGDGKNQARQVLLGLLGFGGFTMLVSVILPALGIMTFTNLDSPSSLIFATLTFVAIVKYRFLGIKVILTQALALVLVSMSFVEIFYARDVQEMIFRLLFFVVMFIAGLSLIKSVMVEVSRKEELQIMADKLAAANDALRKLDNAKTEFISIASHQLRTPVTVIKGFTSLILEGSYGEFSDSIKGALERMYTSSERLVNLIEDLLNVSRIESGRMTFVFEKASMEKLIREMHDNFILIAKTKKFYLDIKLPEVSLPEIMMDYSKIRELVSNFIDNALKYTEKGGATVKAELRDEGVVIDENGFVIPGQKSEFGKMIRITVSDTGIGIPKEEIPYLFKKFSRGKDVSRLHVGGTGLGLYVGKAIAEAHHGQVWVESDGAGLGSRFIIEIPSEHVA